MDYVREWRLQEFNRRDELQLARLLAIAAVPLQNLLVAKLLDREEPKSVPQLVDVFSSFEYQGTDSKEALRKGLERLVELHSRLLNLLTQSLSFDELAYYEMRGSRVSYLMYRDNVRMVERRCGAGLLLEAAQTVFILSEFDG